MNDRPTLGQLTPADFPEEALLDSTRFSTWQAKPEVLALLCAAVDITPDLDSIERGQGLSACEFLCTDQTDTTRVLVKCHLDSSNPEQIGDVLTSAAGLDAGVVIWTTKKCSLKLRATFDWLNKLARGRCLFYAVELSFWRIADSPAAPMFNVVARPNTWACQAQASER